MKRIISNMRNDKAVKFAIDSHSKQESGESTIRFKFFLAHFLSEYTDDQSIIQMCFLHGFSEGGMKEHFPWYEREDENFLKECAVLKDISKMSVENISRLILDATPRQSLLIAAYVANRMYQLDDDKQENMSYIHSYKELKKQLAPLIYLLGEKVPEPLFNHLVEKHKETFDRMDEKHGQKAAV